MRAEKERQQIAAALANGTLVAVDRTKIVSRSAVPTVPDFYRDVLFACKRCGKEEVWTAKQQKRWHEEQGGEIEAIAISCNDCRRKERARKAAARKVHLDGLAAKKAKA